MAPFQKKRRGNKFFIFLFRIKTEETTVLSTEDQLRNVLLKEEKMRRREKGRAVQFDYFLLASVAARSKLDLTTKRNKEREVEISKSREEKKVCE